ncbi:MAG: stage II sporulation protein D [bacterium]|nr:MAG: stage II sporulation protein D [bacterium]
MSKIFIIGQVFFVLLLLFTPFFSVIAVEEQNLTPKLKIGLFNLLKPQTIDIQVIGNEVVSLKIVSGNSGQRDFLASLLSPKEVLTLVATTRGITCYLKNSEKQVKQRWLAKSLSISGNNSLQLFVANRLTRQIPAQVSFQLSKNLIQTILSTDKEKAVGIVTASELSAIDNIGPKQALESFKTLSIVIRSYIHHEKARHSKEGYDLCDNTHCLLYLGEEALASNKQQAIIERALVETSKIVIRYENEIVPGYFTACCGGLTALPKEVWTAEHPSSYVFQSIRCNYCQKDRFYQWERTTKTKYLWRALEPILAFQPKETTQLIAKYNQKGVVIGLLVKDRSHLVKISPARFRHLIGQELGWNLVLSNFYQITPKGQQIIFQGKGFGHNLGLCLAGANEQARQGVSFSEILQFYFPNTTLSQIQ